MGFTLRLLLGVFLTFLVCGLSDGAYIRNVREADEKNSTTVRYVDVTEKNILDLKFGRRIDSDKNVKNKDSKPKTDVNLDNVNNSDIHTERKITLNDLGDISKNLTTVKLEKSESYRKSEPSYFEVTPKSDNVENVIKSDINKDITITEEYENKDNKENVIKSDSSENKETKREEKGRSIDVDVDKYVSPEFHNINNVYTVPISPDTEKYVDHEFDHKTETPVIKNRVKDSSVFMTDLTTPKTDFFDNKYREAVDSVDQKLEHLDSPDFSDTKEEINIQKLIDKTKDNDTNSNLDFIKVKNIVNNNNGNRSSAHGDLTVEEGTKIYFESSFNKTDVTEEPNEKLNKINQESIKDTSSKETVTHIEVKELNKQDIETTTQKILLLTTRKPVTLTKPPINRNISHILSNKIETDAIQKSNLLPSTTSLEEIEDKPILKSSTSSSIDITKRGSIKFADYATTTPITTLKPQRTINRNKITDQNKFNKTVEQIVQENQVIPIHVTSPPLDDQTVTDSMTTEVRVRPDEVNKSTPMNLVISTTKIGDFFETTTNALETTTLSDVTTTESSQNVTDSVVTEIDTTTSTFGNTESSVIEGKLNSNLSNTTNFQIELTTIINPTTEIEETTTSNLEITSVPITEQDLTTSNNLSITTPNNLAITEIDIEERIKPASGKVNNESVAKITENTTIYQIITDASVTETASSITETASTTETDGIISTTVKIGETTTDQVIETTTPKEFVSNSSGIINDTTETSSTSTTTSSTSRPTTTMKITSTLSTTTETFAESTTSKKPSDYSTTKEFDFVPVENTTTLLPDVIDPYNYPSPDIVEPDVKSPNTTTEEDTTKVTESSVDPDENNKGTIAAIVISSVGAVCLILLAGLLYIMRKRQKRFNYGQRCTPVSLDDYSMDNVSSYNSVRRKGGARASKRSYGNPAFDDPVAVTHPLNFPALAKFASNLEDIKAEFEEIPQISARTSELPEGCETKNRYANVIPLPETRVFLNVIEGYPNSDYINANYVTGPKNTKGYYIACQGPMQNTVDDFWRMVWEQQSKVILMLTQLFENGIEKCVDYLPPSEVLDCHRLFGDFQVTLKKREVKDKYIISSLQLKNMVSNSWREVTHFWYLGWPEKGVPKESNSIIAFLIEARSYMKSSTIDKKNGVNGITNGAANSDVNPVVVHCSPGTGRTGVVIACDIAIREFEKTRLVDIPRIVYRIRRDRASSVQTKEQYEFIYKVVSLYAAKLTGGALDAI